MTVSEILKRPVAWSGLRLPLYVLLAAGLAFLGGQWFRLREDLSEGFVHLGKIRYQTKPYVAEERPRIARQEVIRAPISRSVPVRPLELTPKQERALEKEFDLKLTDVAEPVRVTGVWQIERAPYGASAAGTVDSDGKPVLVVKANKPPFLETGPWVLDVGIVSEDGQGGRVAVSKDVRVGKVAIYGRAQGTLLAGTLSHGLEAGLRFKF